MTKGDFRLYTYGGYGNLEKVGDLKTDGHGIRRRHFFSSLEEVTERVALLKQERGYEHKQYLIIEYASEIIDSKAQNSWIVKIIN